QVGTVGEGIEPVVGALGLTALERGLRWAVLLTVATLPLSEAAKNVGFAVSLALYLAVLLLHDRKRPGVPLVGLGLLGLLGATVLSALASEYPYPAARGVWEVFRHVSFFFIVLRAFRLDGDIRRFVAAIAAGTGMAALIFFYQYFVVGMPLFRFLSIGGKNASAQFLVMVLLLLLSVLAVGQVEGGERWALAGTAVGLLLVLGVSEARTMWLAFIFLGLGLAVWVRRWVIAAAVAGLVFVVAVVATQDEAVRNRLVYLSTPRGFLQLSGRIPVWQQSLRIWRDHPWLGVGPRAFKIDEDVTRDPVRSRYGIEGSQGQAHNLWVHTAAEMGTIGLLAVLGWVAAVATFLWRVRAVRGDPWVRALWVGTVGAFGAMMIAALTEPAIGYEHSLLLNAELALLAGTGAPAGIDDSPRWQKPGAEELRQ
ncbi:MAG: O-antigen ligase family protein, partial [Candidatus Methylomirabilales bacterium]